MCQEITVPEGLLLAVIVPKLTVGEGHAPVALVVESVGAVEPATQGAAVTVVV